MNLKATIFLKKLQKVLDQYPDWRAYSIGDEDRREFLLNIEITMS